MNKVLCFNPDNVDSFNKENGEYIKYPDSFPAVLVWTEIDDSEWRYDGGRIKQYEWIELKEFIINYREQN